MTVVVLYLCFYCFSSGGSCACKSDCPAREAAAVTCPSFTASARVIYECFLFYTKEVNQISFFLMCFFECVTTSLMKLCVLWDLHATAMFVLSVCAEPGSVHCAHYDCDTLIWTLQSAYSPHIIIALIVSVSCSLIRTSWLSGSWNARIVLFTFVSEVNLIS